MRPKFFIILILIITVTAACASETETENGDLPTRVQVATFDTSDGAPTEVVAVFTAGATVTQTDSLPPSYTPTPRASATGTIAPSVTISVTPSSTITDTPSPTVTWTPSATLEPDPLVSLAELALQATVLPPTYIVPAAPVVPGGTQAAGQPLPPIITATSASIVPTLDTNCQFLPDGNFGLALSNNPTLLGQMGCPVGAPPTPTQLSVAIQGFERGWMLWVSQPTPTIYALFEDGFYRRYPDTWNPATDAASSGEPPPPDRLEPVRGFGKVWRDNPEVRDGLGWGINGEQGDTASVLSFAQGQMIFLPSRGEIFVITGDSTQGGWLIAPG
jgi:hypothetical protein